MTAAGKMMREILKRNKDKELIKLNKLNLL